jgi:predicted permease
MLDSLWQDVRHSARMLTKNPGFTAVAVLSIALGVGANAAMFSLADGLVLRPLQVPRAGEVVALGGNDAAATENAGFGTNRSVSYRDYVDVRDRARSFAGLAAYRVFVAGFAMRADEPAQSQLGLAVSGNFFDVLGVRPVLGRTFGADEDTTPGRDAVIVLAHDTWTERFGSDPNILERRVRLGGREFTVVGVAPASFAGMHLALHPVFYLPLAISSTLPGAPAGMLDRRDVRALTVRGRLAPGVSLAQARQETEILAADLQHAYPDTNRSFDFLLRWDFDARLEEAGPNRPGAFLLMALAAVVLIVACANVAGLLTSRAPARARELAVRMAIGGGRLRVMRQLLTESGLIAACGGALGLGAGYVILPMMRSEVVSDIGVRITVGLDRRAVVVGLMATAASTLLSSLVPAWRASRATDLTSSLRPGSSSSERVKRLWGRHSLVVGQVALSLVMLIVAVFVYRGFAAEFSRPGFRTSQMLLVSLNPALAGYDTDRTDRFYRQLVDRVRTLPSVQSVGLTSVVPLNQDSRDTSIIVPEGYQFASGSESVAVSSARVDEGYLETMDIPLVGGRGFRSTDSANAPPVAIVNRTMAARYWPNQDPIGKRLRVGGITGPWVQVVGVAADSKYNWIGEGPTPFLYLPRRQNALPSGKLLVATDGPAAALVTPLRDVLRELDPDLPTSPIRTMEAFFQGSAVSGVTRAIPVVGAMGVMGLVLALVGLYSLMAYAVARRTREIGIRLAVGAAPGFVLGMILRHGAQLVMGGIALGLLGSAAIGGLLRALLPSRGGIDVTTYLVVVPALAVVTLLAACIPAYRASRIDPLVALRQE